MQKLYKDEKTPELVESLKEFWIEQQKKSKPKWPDDTYFQAAGQEPPPPPKRHWLHWLVINFEISLMMVVIAALLVLLAIYSR
jgi:hypothetical protein